jgi:hypothetical protein
MTSQDAGASAKDGTQLDTDEADRLASMIRPAWDLEGGELSAQADEGGGQLSGADAALAGGGVDAAVSSGAAKSLEPSRDTVIDGTPLVAIGTTDPGAAPPPKPAGPTKLGLGGDVAAALAATEPAMPPARAAAVEEPEAPAAKPEPEAPAAKPEPEPPPRKSAVSTSVMPATPLAPTQPRGASPSKFDDPIELPVSKGSNMVVIAVGAAFALAVLVIGGILALGSGDAPAERKDKPAASEAEPSRGAGVGPTATSRPAETAAPAPTEVKPAETAAPASPSVTSAPTPATAAETSAPATAAPVAKGPPDRPPAQPKPGGGQPPSKPPGGGGKKPGSGGIMRETPF